MNRKCKDPSGMRGVEYLPHILTGCFYFFILELPVHSLCYLSYWVHGPFLSDLKELILY